MPSVLEFPYTLLREQTSTWSLGGNVITPGQTASGLNPAARTDGGGFWKSQLNSVYLRTADHVRCWRAISAYMDGGSRAMAVPICDKRFFPAPIVGGERLVGYGDIPHSDETLFSDDTGYYQPVVVCEVVTAASRRSTSLTIQFSYGGPLRGGELFSIQHTTYDWRLYEIFTVTENSNGTTTISFRPGLREAVVAGDAVEFDFPRCTMRLTSSDAMDMTLQHRKFGQAGVTFIEAMPPFT